MRLVESERPVQSGYFLPSHQLDQGDVRSIATHPHLVVGQEEVCTRKVLSESPWITGLGDDGYAPLSRPA